MAGGPRHATANRESASRILDATYKDLTGAAKAGFVTGRRVVLPSSQACAVSA
jgi:hypothetical protein